MTNNLTDTIFSFVATFKFWTFYLKIRIALVRSLIPSLICMFVRSFKEKKRENEKDKNISSKRRGSLLVSLRETLRFSFYQMSTWSSVRIMKSLRSGLGSIRSIFMTALVDLSFFLPPTNINKKTRNNRCKYWKQCCDRDS